jgi:hypothetical protein
MTTRKITTFLMCPAANGDALGGTPAASAASGGHIKKSAWVHVFDAASVSLVALLAKQPAAQIAEAKDSAESTDAEEDCVIDQEAAQDHDDADEEEGPGQETVHDLFPSSLGGGEIKSAANHSPVVQRVQLFNRNAGGDGHQRALAVRNATLGKPVLDVLTANVTADGSSQGAGATVVEVKGFLDARFLAHGMPRVAK